MGLQLCIIEGHTVCLREGKCYILVVQTKIHLGCMFPLNAENSQTQIHLGTYLIMMKTGGGV